MCVCVYVRTYVPRDIALASIGLLVERSSGPTTSGLLLWGLGFRLQGLCLGVRRLGLQSRFRVYLGFRKGGGLDYKTLSPGSSLLPGSHAAYGCFRKLGVPYSGVPMIIIRILLFRVLYQGPHFRKLSY